MSVSTVSNPSINVAAVSVWKAADAAKDKDAAPKATTEDKPAEPNAAEGVKVVISGAGMGMASAEKSSNSDIDESSLSDSAKTLLKMIRELKKQLAEKMAELSAAMADTSLTPEAQRARVANIQGDVAMLQAALVTAQTQLGKVLKSEPPQAQMEAMSLMAK
ncbi:hypothetical protein [Pseudomonas salomonii]|uniref:FlxA-like protein n=1 Tax=Pseudomonas salomonii TaxID=191391 RepID=A0A1H3MXL8_9PSED|nr:hypothetical protein [Pseudomonas salomonii]NWF06851.1 hypothetical protein [Pseudomonas salomonii]SDY81336.1 hypothetical protein SAMN05216247_105213 [Pseudomonas salomonii]